MEQAVSMKWIIKNKYIYTIMLLIFLLVTGIFMYLFFTNTKISSFLETMAEGENGPPKFSRMIYGGFGDEALNKPMDLALVDSFIYVTDTNNKRVQVFDSFGTPIAKFGKEGEEEGQFKFPYGITGDSRGNIYVADLYNGSISIFDSKGKFIKYFAETNPDDKVLEAPAGLRIIDNKVYVTEIRQSKVMVFDLAGKKLLEFGKVGKKDGEFRAPNAVTADGNGNIYVVDTGNQRVQVFDKAGKFLRKFNGSKDGNGSSIFVNPRGIGIDSRGIIYVVSNLTHYIYGFDKEGKQVFVFGGNGVADDQFALPNGLLVDETDQVFITDTTNQRVAVYEL